MKSQRSSESEDVAEACEVPGNNLNMNRINLYSNDVGALSVVEGKRDSLTLSASSDSISSSGCVVSSSMSPSQPLRTVSLDPGSSAPDVAEAKESPGKGNIGKSGLMSKMSNMDIFLEDGVRRQQAAKEASHTISTILTQSLKGNKDSAPSNSVDPKGPQGEGMIIPLRDEIKSSLQAYPMTHSHSHAEIKGTGDFHIATATATATAKTGFYHSCSLQLSYYSHSLLSFITELVKKRDTHRGMLN